MPNTEQEPVAPTTGRLSKWSSVALGALAVVLALIALDVTLVGGLQSPASAQTRPVTQVVKVSGVAVQPVVDLTVSAGLKPGPDGKLHDAFSVTNFYTHVGQPVKLIINNTDTVAHSIMAPGAGVNIIVRPGTHTYTLLIRKAGRFQWMCMMPCDPYSMSHDGYMRGYIIAS
jgi:heme/copper-type cytochrome/quinol oxidase subunit 2